MNTPPPVSSEIPPGGPTVTVTAFNITGNTVFGTDVLQQQIAAYVGKDLTLAELYKVADSLTRYYQSRGYGLARATLPEQQLSGGKVTLQIVEGRIGAQSVEGNTRTRSGVILKQASGVKNGDVYTDAAMDRSTLLVNDLPGVQAQAVLQPGSVFGTADVVYKVQEDSEYSGQLSLDDYGRADVGRWRLNAEADVAGFTGGGDKLTANITHTEGNLLNFGALNYSLPLGAPGGRLSASYNQSEYHVGGIFTPLGLSGNSRNGNLSYLYPEIRSHADNLFLGAGFAHEGSESESNPVGGKSGGRISESNLNLLQFTALYSATRDDGSSYSLTGTFASNGHRDDGNDSGAERGRFELDGSHVKPLGDTWYLLLRGGGVWSPDPLADTEKFSLGGPDSVRGFLSADARGDSGLFASAEVQHSLVPAWPVSIGWFVDSGKVWSKRFDTPVTGRDPSTGKTVTVSRPTPGEAHTLTSVGAEIIFQSSNKRWESRLQWAWAVGGTEPSDGNEGGHIWATFGMNF